MYKLSSAYPFNLIFDLDGTLIDSHEGVVQSLKYALADSGIYSELSSSQIPIGPPLSELIHSITDCSDPSFIQPIVASFKNHYDSKGYTCSRLFEGVSDFLASLKAANFSLYIATNKRLLPTLKILKHLSIDMFFDDVYAVDSPGYFGSKSQMLNSLIAHHNLHANTIYIGDRFDDFDAARENLIPFFYPHWGYSTDHSLFPKNTLGIHLCSANNFQQFLLS